MTRVIKWTFGILGTLFFLFMLAANGFVLPFTGLFYLLFGWGLFLARNLRDAAISPSGFVTAVVPLVAFTACLHGLLKWFYAAWKESTPAETGEAEASQFRPWRFAWTLCITALVILMFVAGTAMIGVTHQVVWMATSKERMVDNTSGRRMRDLGYRTMSANHLRNIDLGLLDHNDKNTALPAGVTCDSKGQTLHGWQTYLLPYVEQKALFERIDLDRPWNDEANSNVFKTGVPLYRYEATEKVPTHDDRGMAISTYAGNVHVLGGTRRWKISEITDGTSKTILTGEVKAEFKPWGSPTNWRDPQEGINKTPSGFGGPWPGGNTNFGMADGSVRTLHESIDPVVLKALSTPGAGDEVNEND